MSNYRHGKKRDPIYSVWSSMLARCLNKNCAAYKNYGGRGISVCDRWMKFENFYSDMGDPPAGMSLDRTNNDLGYSPENCCWADRKSQNRNRRSVKLLTINGIEKPVFEWGDAAGLSRAAVRQRLLKGWSPEEAVLTPKIVLRKGIKRGEKLRDYA